MISKPITKASARILSVPLANEDVDLSQGVPAASIATSLARVGDYLALTKPRVMSLVLFTAVVVAPGHLDALAGFAAILCIALGAGAAGALNMWYEADVDALMSRTARRPIPRGRVSPEGALAFGLTTTAVSCNSRMPRWRSLRAAAPQPFRFGCCRRSPPHSGRSGCWH